MTSARGIENTLRLIASTAEQRRPLPEALRSAGGELATALAERLERGEDLPTAFATLQPADVRMALLGPRPPLERSALFIAEQLRRKRDRTLVWIDIIAHPLLTLLGAGVAVGVVAHLGGYGFSLVWLLAFVAVLLVGASILYLSTCGRLAAALPSIGAFGHHLRQSDRYQRAALVARWRLPEADLVALLGADLGGLGAVLAQPQAEAHCQRLASYHGHAQVRAQRRLAWVLAGVVYIAAGTLLLAVGTQPVAACVATLESLATSD